MFCWTKVSILGQTKPGCKPGDVVDPDTDQTVKKNTAGPATITKKPAGHNLDAAQLKKKNVIYSSAYHNATKRGATKEEARMAGQNAVQEWLTG